VARVNITKQIKTAHGWRNVALTRDARHRIKWTVGSGRYILEWRENGRRRRAAAGVTPAEALEAQKRKRLELGAKESGLELSGLEEEDASIPLQKAVESFLKDIKTFRKPMTHQKYEYVLELFAEHVAPKSDARLVSPEDIKKFLAWRKSKGMDPGTTLYTDRVILHNFFNKLGLGTENPVKKVPRLPKFRKRPVAYPDTELQKFFAKCDDWERAFFSLVLATGLRRGELQTLHWSDLDLAHRRVHVRAKPQYAFLPKDWEERTVPFSKELAEILKKHPRTEKCPLVFPSVLFPGRLSSPSFLHDLCKAVAKRAGLDEKEWHLHRFRDTAATRWLRAGIDVRTVQEWLGHESLATTQKYLEPSKETEKHLEEMKLPF
jgi:integrase/recombinase XerD